MDWFILLRIRVCVLFLCFVSASAVWGEDSKALLSTRTHLNGTSRQIVWLSTECLPNDNSSDSFFYDRDRRAPFTVPKGFSFVITDIIADFRGAKSAHILHRNPQCFSRILLLFVS